MEERFNLILCDFTEELCEEWRLAFADFPEVEIRYGIFEHIDFDCINSPANSFGLMDGGIDEAITMYFGQQMMDRVQNARKKTMGKGNFAKNSHAEKELNRL